MTYSSVFFRKATAVLAVLVTMVAAGFVGAGSKQHASQIKGHPNEQMLQGTIESGGVGLPGYEVSLYASYTNSSGNWRKLGTRTTDDSGDFSIRYRLPDAPPQHTQPLLFVLAENGPAMLASAIGRGPGTDGSVIINERTTVATGSAFAQFIDGRRIRGNEYGMINAVHMAANMADPETGALGAVLASLPNADATSTMATFNSLANIVAGCVLDRIHCVTMFAAATPGGGMVPTTVLQALANMTKYAGAVKVGELFTLSFENAVYGPMLADDEEPASWLLFIKFTGGFYSEYDYTNLMSGPGNVAFDKRGFAWINDNYVPTPELQLSCAGLRLMQFYPWGESFPGSPYFGGGLSGAGFGISIDRHGDIWVGNYGFEAPVCDGSLPPDPINKIPATHDSVSLFRPDGEPVSGPDGFTGGHIWWPQGTVPDRKGNIWVANCGNDTVTVIPQGDPRRAWNIALPGGQGAEGNYVVELPKKPRLKPFAVAIDPRGRAWVTANKAGWINTGMVDDPLPAGMVFRISRDGSVERLPRTDGTGSASLLSWPMGISGDSQGNMWVSNSDSVNVPCVTPLNPQDGPGASIVLYRADDSPPTQYMGGGITIPWGNAVDGNDTLWVFNFGHKPTDAITEPKQWPDTSVSHFCGVDESKCPPGLGTGDPISPHTGYTTNALDRVTGGGIDPSGNLWLMNNWKKSGPYSPIYDTNPGGNSFVIVPGAAAPLKTPLIGPPRGF